MSLLIVDLKVFLLIILIINMKCWIRGGPKSEYNQQIYINEFPSHYETVTQFKGGYSGAEVFKAIDHSQNDLNILLKGSFNNMAMRKEANNLKYVEQINSPYFQKILSSFDAKKNSRNYFYIITDFVNGEHYDNFDLNKGTKKVKINF